VSVDRRRRTVLARDEAPAPGDPEETQIVVSRPPVTSAPAPDETQVVVSESALTTIIRTDAPAKRPVFVDPSGRRGRRVRRWAYGIGVVVLLIVAAAWVVQLDGWAKPPTPPASGVNK
jgi:hypothetical protein